MNKLNPVAYFQVTLYQFKENKLVEGVRFGNNLFLKRIFSFLFVKKELRDGNILHLTVKKKRIILDLISHPNYTTQRPHCVRLVRFH